MWQSTQQRMIHTQPGDSWGTQQDAVWCAGDMVRRATMLPTRSTMH